MKACRPRAISSRMKLYIAMRLFSPTQSVWTGFRPGGISSMTETSRSPYRVMARVRGMGVAVITSTCGATPPAPLDQSFARWSTPKRCCSSTIASPRALNTTVSSMRACVPTMRPMLPSWSPAWISRRAATPVEPVRRAAFTPVGARYLVMFAKCWCARTSVGAIRQAW